MARLEGWMRLSVMEDVEVHCGPLGWRPCKVRDEETGVMGVVIIYETREQAEGPYGRDVVRIEWNTDGTAEAPY